jgi:hypothetical protein
MTLEQLEIEIEIMLKALKVQHQTMHLLKNVATQFVCDDFGLIVIAVPDQQDVSYVRGYVDNKLKGYRLFVITDFSDTLDIRQNLVWALMEGGYIKYIRQNFPRQFNDLITMQNYGNKIIDERLKRWNNCPKNLFFINENMRARRVASTMILSIDPGFFDYMPPIEETK